MNRLYLSHALYSIIFVLVQVLLLQNIQLAVLNKYTLAILIYPAVIMYLPLEMRRSLVIITAFFVGLIIDIFYDSLGIHTAALVLTGFIRALILQLIEPRQGYRNATALSVSNYGFGWVALYTAIMMFIHILAFYSVDQFSPVFIVKILVSTALTFVVSYIIIMLYKALV